MRVFGLILEEARHRRLNSALVLLGIIVAVALPVLYFTTGAASKRETTRLMRDMGYNLRIIPKDTELADYWRDGHSKLSMPADAVSRFASQTDVSYNHLSAMLTRRIDWRGKPVLVTGIAQEVAPAGKKKSSMIFAVEPGTIYVGHEPATRLGLKKGETVDLAGRSFRIAECLVETGTQDDVRVWLALGDAQEVLDAPGQINEIKALECYCKDPSVDNVAKLRTELARIVPEGKVVRMEAIAEVREKQRRMSERYFAIVLPIVLLACALWVAFLTMVNVRERSPEIGVLRALGHGSGRIASLLLGKAILLGVAGAVIGFGLGTLVSLWLGPAVFETTAGQIRVDWSLLGSAIVVAPVFAAVSAFIPTVAALTQDPANVLREA